ncbi:hypothetical protein [Corallococcus llansteffanensis]|uniref:Uncharacterized protein n=1 Tax=Corallococcus llansteffanensis TaxID=2316731 RepID=A0A3A8Q2R3_9BACT|nr:hypothetical protein [Corallococcus llansteffanensis]RKH61230.1 hypothetical protein D7V93_12080 [Corallococcus llansteffanensis]
MPMKLPRMKLRNRVPGLVPPARSKLRRRMAGAVLALALVGALSASMASGVDRARRKKLPRATDLPPQSEEVPLRTVQTPHDLSRPAAMDAPTEASRNAPSREGRKPQALPVKTSGPVVSEAHGMLARAAPEDTRDTDDATPPPTVLATTARVPAPLHVSWRVVETGTDTVRLIARLERSPGFTAPVEVSLRVPSRALLQEGPTSPIVLEGDAQEVPWTLHLPEGTRPDEDLVLLASAEGESFGVHAEARYRFGRELAEATPPAPTGPPLPKGFMRPRD